VSLVECLLTLHNTCQYARTPHEQSVLAAQIAATARQLDRLVWWMNLAVGWLVDVALPKQV
jgi:hypothetical protein